MMRHRAWASTMILVACGLCLSDAPAKAERVRFVGEPISRPEIGLAIQPLEGNSVVAVLSVLTGGAFLLPQEEWKVEIGEDGVFHGESDHYRVTVGQWSSSAESERQYLEELLGRLQQVVLIEDREIFEHGQDLVVRYRGQPKDLPKKLRKLNPWYWNYWSAQRTQRGWLDLHLSAVEPSTAVPEDQRLRELLAGGLRDLAGIETQKE